MRRRNGGGRTRGLLDRMSQFMGEKPSALLDAWIVLTFRKNNVASYRVSQCIHRPRRLRRSCVGVDADLAEVVAEVRLHESARRRVQRLARRAQHFVDDRRHGFGLSGLGSLTLHERFLPTIFALACETGCAVEGALALQKDGPHWQDGRCRRCLGSHLGLHAGTHRLNPPWTACAVRVRVSVSGLYGNTITLASGLKGSSPTMVPFSRRGELGNVLI